MKARRWIPIALAAALLLAALAGCSSSSNSEQEDEDTSNSDIASSTDSTEDDTVGIVLSVSDNQLTLQRYTPISTTSTESDAIDLENYSLSQDTELVALQDDSLFYTADESGTTAASTEDLQAGSIVLVKWDADTGNAAEIILQNDGYTDAASVVSTTEGEVTVSLYQSDALSSSTLSSYDALDLSSSTLEETAQTLTAADDTRIYRYENGLLSSAALSDLSEGDTILVSYTSSASTTPSQIVLISAASSTAS